MALCLLTWPISLCSVQSEGRGSMVGSDRARVDPSLCDSELFTKNSNLFSQALDCYKI